MLILKHIHKSFGAVKALRGVSAEVKKGELVTFVGPSGCGKTTLLRTIGGLTKPDSGDVILDGRTINDLTPDKRGTQMCFQNYALFPHLTVADNVGYGPKVHKWNTGRIKERVEELLHLVHLDGLGDRYIEKLSGGQQQRVALARALALEPKVLLLDEPLSNLDANLRVQMRATLLEIQKGVNITTIFVTHDQHEAMSISDRLFVMKDGMIEQVGAPIEIYQKPKNEFIAGFVGYINILEGVVENIGKETEPAVFSTEIGNLEFLTTKNDVKKGQKVFLVIRPETIRISSSERATGVNELKGIIKSAMYGGSMVKYTVDIQGKRIIVDQFDPITLGIYGIGDKCMVIFPKNVHILTR
jgi:ABC-type Fe3+/spermidine/putrescine transport system ATPase subunit